MTKSKLLPPEPDIYNSDGSYIDPMDYEPIGEKTSLVMHNKKTGSKMTLTFESTVRRGLAKQLGLDFIRTFTRKDDGK